MRKRAVLDGSFIDQGDHLCDHLQPRDQRRALFSFQHNHYDPYHDLISDSDHLITWLQSTVYDLRLITNTTPCCICQHKPLDRFILGNITGRHTLKALQTGSTNSGHTVSPQDMMREIISLRQEVQVLRNGGGNGQVRDIGEAVKPKQPGPFDGTHGTLRDFLTQLKAYHRFYPTKLSDPVEGTPRRKLDFLDNQLARRDNETDVFASFKDSKKPLRRYSEQPTRNERPNRNFENSDKGSQHRIMLRSSVKSPQSLIGTTNPYDELYKENRPDNLSDYIAMAVRIDDRQYARRQEKKQGRGNWNPSYGNNFNRRANYKKKRETPIAYAHTTNPGRMDLDATQKAKESVSTGKLDITPKNADNLARRRNPLGPSPSMNSLTGLHAMTTNVRYRMVSKTTKENPCNDATKGFHDTETSQIAETEYPYPEGVSQDWIRKNGKRFQEDMRIKDRQQRRAVYKQHNKEDTDAALMLTKLGQQPEEDQRSVDTSSEEQETPEETEDENELAPPPSLLRENATIGEHAPYFEEFEEMLKIGTQQIPQILTENQQAAMIRYQPAPRGGDYAVAIAAVDTFTALQREWQPRGEFSDDPRTVLSHEEHKHISWISCVYLDCMIHFQKKARHNAFPVRFDGQILSKPYLSTELDYWKIDQRYPNDQVMLLNPITARHLNAAMITASEPSIFTRLAQRIRCDEEDYNEFHEHEKARAWHNDTTKNYAQNRKTQNENSIPGTKTNRIAKHETRNLRLATRNQSLSPDTTPRDENIKKRYQQQIEEEYPNETNKDQAKRDPRTLCMATASHGNQMVLTSKSRDITYTHYWIAARWAITFHLEHKKDPYELTNIEGEAFNYNNGIIDMEIDHLDINIQGHDERVDFDIMDIGEHDLVLGFHAALERRRKFQDQQIWEKAKFCDDLATEQDERITTHVLTNTAVQPGIRHKQNKGHNKKIQDSSQGKPAQKKEQSPQDRMKNIPQEYRKYDKLFKEELETGLPKHSQWDHEICLKDGRTPTFHKIYNLNEKQLQTLRDYLDENLRKGYIRTSTSEAGYPVMFLRLVVDYRRLNDITMKDRTPLPLISELRDRLHGKKWFTALDLKGAYNLIRMKKGHEWMTAFRTKFGLFEYLVMPFGLTNAPATFQRMINNVLREHLTSLYSAHFRMRSYWLNQKKAREIRMQQDKINSVKEWLTPKNVKDVQNCNTTTRLNEEGKRVYMGRQSQRSFECIKTTITQEPVLTTFDPERQIELETDASDFALGAQIGQKDDEGRLRPIAFYSKKLHGAELNYPIYDKEFLAIIQAFKEFRHYLLGSKHKIKVYTDHKNISHFATTQQLNGRQIRWAECLSEFDYEIIHRKGTENGAPIVKGQLLELNNEGNMQQRQLNAIFKVNPDEGLTKKIQQAYDKLFGKMAWQSIKERSLNPRTMERIRRIYDFPRMKKRISETIRKCELCARSKAERHKPYGELQPLPVPKKPWDSIAFDHITKLPPSKEPMTNVKYDSIFVITDRLTKYGYFLPYKEASNAEELAYVFLRTIVSNHGLPNEIVSDRGSTFERNISSAQLITHKQMDKQNDSTKRLNNIYDATSATNKTIGLMATDGTTSLQQLSHRDNQALTSIRQLRIQPRSIQAERAILQADQLRKLHKEMQQELQFVRERMSTHYNRKRLQGPIFQEGDMVYLVRRNIKTKRPSNKLISRNLDRSNQLRTFATNNNADTPNILYLIIGTSTTKRQTTGKIEVDDDQEYEAEQILTQENKHLTHCDQPPDEMGFSGADESPSNPNWAKTEGDNDTWEYKESQPRRREGRASSTRCRSFSASFSTRSSSSTLSIPRETARIIFSNHNLFSKAQNLSAPQARVRADDLCRRYPLTSQREAIRIRRRHLAFRSPRRSQAEQEGIVRMSGFERIVESRTPQRMDDEALALFLETRSDGMTDHDEGRRKGTAHTHAGNDQDMRHGGKAGLEGKTKGGGDLMLRPDQRMLRPDQRMAMTRARDD
ncbi:reverse transcriptase (RNA-dependent DNA polymerase) [Hirsutella rhossiliensis]